MAALVQSFPSASGSTMTMLQARSASTEAFQNQNQGQSHQRNNQTPRNIYNTSVGGMAAGSYRGQTSASPVSPYAFASTPSSQGGQNPLRQHPVSNPNARMENRAASAPSIPALQLAQNISSSTRPRPPLMNTTTMPLNQQFTNNALSSSQPLPKDQLTSMYNSSRPLSAIDLNTPPLSYATVAKSSPDRYKRNHQRAQTSSGMSATNNPQSGSAAPSGSGMATIGHLYNHPAQSNSSPALSSFTSYRGTTTAAHTTRDQELMAQPRLASKDDMNLQRQPSTELAKRYRRRSISSLEAKEFGIPASENPSTSNQSKTYAAMLAGPAPTERRDLGSSASVDRPTSSHGRNTSAESSVSGRSSSNTNAVSLSSCFIQYHLYLPEFDLLSEHDSPTNFTFRRSVGQKPSVQLRPILLLPNKQRPLRKMKQRWSMFQHVDPLRQIKDSPTHLLCRNHLPMVLKRL